MQGTQYWSVAREQSQHSKKGGADKRLSQFLYFSKVYILLEVFPPRRAKGASPSTLKLMKMMSAAALARAALYGMMMV